MFVSVIFSLLFLILLVFEIKLTYKEVVLSFFKQEDVDRDSASMSMSGLIIQSSIVIHHKEVFYEVDRCQNS